MNSRTRRAGYIAQIGLDFGTAFTKCIVRDLGKDKARTVENGNPAAPYLFPSVVHRGPCAFSGQPRKGYIELPFPKVLISALSSGRSYDARTLAWRGVLPERKELKTAITATAHHLAHVLCAARELADEMMPGFGKHPEDVLYVNMSVPVDDMERPATVGAFTDLLDASIDAARELRGDFKAHGRFLYPEVAANVQAFLRSGFAQGEWGNPFFLVDVGAGTIDQSYFIPTHGLSRLTFLCGVVDDAGSSRIEAMCADASDDPDLQELFRRHKEDGRTLPPAHTATYNQAIQNLEEHVVSLSEYTIQKGRSRLAAVGQRVRHQFGRTRVIFSGGGVCDRPYRVGTLNTFREVYDFEPATIELPRPSDVTRASGRPMPQAWFRRLTVAYGLSFPSTELQEVVLPSQLAPAPCSVPVRSQGGCRGCGRPTVTGDDYCYSCGG